MMEDMLPATLFDTNFSFVDTPPSVQPPQTSNFDEFSSRLPPLDDIENDVEDDNQAKSTTAANTQPWSITGFVYESLCLSVQGYSAVLPTGCSLPSRSTLVRYLKRYLVCVAKCQPFIHFATFSVEQKEIELLLAMATFGALYSFELSRSYEMYFMAKAVLSEKKRREDLQLTSDLLSAQSHSTVNPKENLGRIQTFVLLITFASWANKSILPDALSMGSQLAQLVRENGISESDEMPQGVNWLSWVAIEERRRTLLSAYALFNMHSVAFSIPPLILNHEVGVFLPGFSEQWKSKNATEWQLANRQVELRFQDGLRSFFDGTGIAKDATVSAFSNYLLIHGLLQQIYVNRHGFSLQPETIKSFETALSTWQSSWELSYESTLDPLTPKGPLGLSATALLRLAYIRLSSDLGSYEGLFSVDLRGGTGKSSNLSRLPHVDRAILHAAHALSIPVRLGIEFVARTQTPIWTIEHSLCSRECALVLKDWLEMISTIIRSCGTEGLRKVERKFLGIITGIIKETRFSKTLDILEDDASRYQRMAATVVQIWAEIFQGVHILEIDNAIGASLQLLADSSLG